MLNQEIKVSLKEKENLVKKLQTSRNFNLNCTELLIKCRAEVTEVSIKALFRMLELFFRKYKRQRYLDRSDNKVQCR